MKVWSRLMRMFGRDYKDLVAEREEIERIQATQEEREKKLEEAQHELDDTERRLEALSTELRMLLRAGKHDAHPRGNH